MAGVFDDLAEDAVLIGAVGVGLYFLFFYKKPINPEDGWNGDAASLQPTPNSNVSSDPNQFTAGGGTFTPDGGGAKYSTGGATGSW